jgi:cbb3-type cytochrome oxidase cytochrome c subunit
MTTAVLLCCLFLITLFYDIPDGTPIFRREGCINCHSFKGNGGAAGPELTAVTKRRSDSWIRQQIKDPKSHNNGSMMPSFDHLSRKEVTALIRYLKS